MGIIPIRLVIDVAGMVMETRCVYVGIEDQLAPERSTCSRFTEDALARVHDDHRRSYVAGEILFTRFHRKVRKNSRSLQVLGSSGE